MKHGQEYRELHRIVTDMLSSELEKKIYPVHLSTIPKFRYRQLSENCHIKKFPQKQLFPVHHV